MVEAGGEIISEVEEETSQEEDATVVLHISLVEDIIITQVIQVVKGLINKKYNIIIVRNLVIMHMNAGRSNMTKESKARTSRRTLEICRVQFSWHAHPQLNAIPFKKVDLTYGI